MDENLHCMKVQVVRKSKVCKMRMTRTFSATCYKSQERTFIFIEIIGNTEQFLIHFEISCLKIVKMKQNKSSSQHSLLQEATFLFGYLGRRQTPLTTYHVQNIDTNKECSFNRKYREGHRKGWLDNEMA